MKTRLTSLILLVLMGAAWGLQFAMLKMADNSGYTDLQVLVLALGCISIVYGLLVLLRRRWVAITRHALVFFVVTALVGYIIPIVVTLTVAPHLSAGVIVILASLAPAVTFATAALFRTEHISTTRLVAVVLGICSVLVLMLPGITGEIFSLWVIAALIVPLCYGMESVYVDRSWPEGMDVIQVGFAEAFTAFVLIFPLVYFGDGFPTHIDPDGRAEIAIAVFVLCSLFEIFAYFYLIRTTGGVLVSFGSFIALFAGVGWGILLFNEQHGWLTWMAAALMLSSLLMVSVDAYLRSRGQRQRTVL